jgi:hypothetical protein
MFRTLLIAVAIFGIGWGASFGAGVAFGRRSNPAAQAAGPANLPPGGVLQVQGAPGGATAPGGGAQGGPGGAAGQLRVANVATVDRVEGQTLFVTGPNNQPVRVALTGQTQILKQATGTPADLAPGTRIAIQPQGQPAADGSLTAASITVVPDAAAGAQRPGPGQGGGGPAGQAGGR